MGGGWGQAGRGVEGRGGGGGWEWGCWVVLCREVLAAGCRHQGRSCLPTCPYIGKFNIEIGPGCQPMLYSNSVFPSIQVRTQRNTPVPVPHHLLPHTEPLRLNLTLPGSDPANPSAPRGLNFTVPRNVTLDADQLQVC